MFLLTLLLAVVHAQNLITASSDADTSPGQDRPARILGTASSGSDSSCWVCLIDATLASTSPTNDFSATMNSVAQLLTTATSSALMVMSSTVSTAIGFQTSSASMGPTIPTECGIAGCTRDIGRTTGPSGLTLQQCFDTCRATEGCINIQYGKAADYLSDPGFTYCNLFDVPIGQTYDAVRPSSTGCGRMQWYNVDGTCSRNDTGVTPSTGCHLRGCGDGFRTIEQNDDNFGLWDLSQCATACASYPGCAYFMFSEREFCMFYSDNTPIEEAISQAGTSSVSDDCGYYQWYNAEGTCLGLTGDLTDCDILGCSKTEAIISQSEHITRHGCVDLCYDNPSCVCVQFGFEDGGPRGFCKLFDIPISQAIDGNIGAKYGCEDYSWYNVDGSCSRI